MASMIQRTGRDGKPEYWSRLGWSYFFAMPLDDKVAAEQCEGWKRQFPNANVCVVPFQKLTALTSPRLANYTR